MSRDTHARQAAADADYWALVGGPERAVVVRRPSAPKTDVERGPFGALLRDLRLPRRLSQSKLAERAGYDHSFVSRIEAGSRQPTRDAAQRLARALDLDAVGTSRLLAAAGFLSGDNPQAVLDREPALADVVALLRDDAMPPDLRDSFRGQLLSLTSVYRMAARVSE